MAAVNYLAAVTNVSRPVVIHALLVNSGVVKDALEYLKHPNGSFPFLSVFFSTLLNHYLSR